MALINKPKKNTGEYTNSDAVQVVVNREEETTRIDEPNENLIYLGFSELDADPSKPVWKIKRIQVVGTETRITYADGNRLYDNIWNDRTSLTYK
ncbi:MAG: hypothetical protein ACOC33_03115 [bacterium]